MKSATNIRRPAHFALLTVTLGLSLVLGGCLKSGQSNVKTSSVLLTQEQYQQQVDELGPKYEKRSDDKKVALAYARALRGVGRGAQAVAVLETIAVKHHSDKEVLAAFGKALLDVGRAGQAEEVLGRAHSPDKPDWTVLSAQGIAADQLGEHVRAQKMYESALVVSPGETAVLTNYGLSLALSGNLAEGETMLRRAVESPRADVRARQNLALVLALRGKKAEAITMAARDQSPAEAEAFIASVGPARKPSNSWSALAAQNGGPAPGKSRSLSTLEGVN